MTNKTTYAVLTLITLEALLTHLHVTDGLFMPLVVRILGSFWALPV